MGKPRRRWVDNIRMDLQEVGCGYVDWIGLAQDRDRWRKLVSAVMNLRVPWNARNFLTSCKPVSCSGRTLHHAVSKYVKILYFVPFSQTWDYLYALPFIEERLVPHPIKAKVRQNVVYKNYYLDFSTWDCSTTGVFTWIGACENVEFAFINWSKEESLFFL